MREAIRDKGLSFLFFPFFLCDPKYHPAWQTATGSQNLRHLRHLRAPLKTIIAYLRAPKITLFIEITKKEGLKIGRLIFIYYFCTRKCSN